MQPKQDKYFIQQRLDFIGLDKNAQEALRGSREFIAKAIGPALDAFYAKVKTSEMRSFFRDEAHMEKAKQHQSDHWRNITAATFDENYGVAMSRIGEAHARIGLEPRWYIGGYALILEQLIHAFFKENWPKRFNLKRANQDAPAQALSSLIKTAMLDMDIAISVYLDALEEKRKKAEEAENESKRQALEAVSAISIAVSKLAANDLTYRITTSLPETYQTLAKDFNGAIEHVAVVLGTVMNSAETIKAGTHDISEASDSLARRTEQQAASLEETAAAIDQITMTVKRSSEAVEKTRGVVEDANQEAQSSAHVVSQAVDAMDAISKSALQISQIIGVIDEIAFQTNLLALNAGVEAARAGEAGRGFAVVASEVRGLAQRSAEAAKEIKTLIHMSTTQVKNGVEQVAKTGTTVEKIMLQVRDMNLLMTQIANGSQEQATGLEEINAAVNIMDQVTQQNAAMAEQSNAACHSLFSETEDLSVLISTFKLPTSVESRKSGTIAHEKTGVVKTSKSPSTVARRTVNGGVQSSHAVWEDF